jgi:putative DNA primase/helicase
LSINDLEEKFGPIDLHNKLVNLGDDVPYYLKETATLKKLVTGEEFLADQKYKQPINFENFATLIFTTNKLPEVSDKSTGFYRRLMIIELNNKITKPDMFFFDRLTDADYEYLLSKAISAVTKAIKNGKLTSYDGAEEKLEKYRREQSATLSFLTDMTYNRDNLYKKPCMVVYKEFEQYCRDVGLKVVKKTNFDSELCRELNMVKKNTTNMKVGDMNQTWRYC